MPASTVDRSPRQRNVQLTESPNHSSSSHSPSSTSTTVLLPPPRLPSPTPAWTQDSIGEYRRSEGQMSPCPALNSLCNHGAYGMPRDGKNVSAFTLAKALVKVYGLNWFFAYSLSIGAFLGITKGKSFSLDLEKLRDAPIAHFAALVHLNPSARSGGTSGRSSAFLVRKMLSHNVHDLSTFDIKEFATWRNLREAQVEEKMPNAQKVIAAGELALLLQVFGDAEHDYAVPVKTLNDFLDYEKLPTNWRPTGRVGYRSTIHVGDRIRTAMAHQTGRFHMPVYVWLLVFLSSILGVIYVLDAVF